MITNNNKIFYHDIKCSRNPVLNITQIYISLKGCNLNCPWCLIQDVAKNRKVLQFTDSECDRCMKCTEVCTNNAHIVFDSGNHTVKQEQCKQCGKCTGICISGNKGFNSALNISGTLIQAYDMFMFIKGFTEINNTKNEVIFGGGEPLLQHRELHILMKLLKKENIKVTIESSLSVPYEYINYIAEFVDKWIIRTLPKNYNYEAGYETANPKVVKNNLRYLNNMTKTNIMFKPYKISEKVYELNY